jgi:hypothetical protein
MPNGSSAYVAMFEILEPFPIATIVDRCCLLDVKVAELRSNLRTTMVLAERTDLRAAIEPAVGKSGYVATIRRDLTDIHKRLWKLENQIRGLEARRMFTSEFMRVGISILVLNRRRRMLRDDLAAKLSVDAGADEDLVWLATGIDSYLDRLAIRRARAFDGSLIQAYETNFRSSVGVATAAVDGFATLLSIHSKMSEGRDRIDALLLRDEMQCSEGVRLLRSIYLLNDARTRVMGKIRFRFPSNRWDVKEYAEYESPPDWDARLLAWRDSPTGGPQGDH